ncbi:MAG: DUF1579 domain-containing protein [Acidobacteria bacterium]|jgi:hypothetical protein|nr:DUF1579 domain-containing protein [Acidobacteriota bacterium]
MKTNKNLIICLVILFFIGPRLQAAASAQQSQQPEEEQKMMKRWMEYTSPGENHKYLEYFAGDWEITSTIWVPGANPEVSRGFGASELIIGGRYLKSYIKGSMMQMPYEGFTITGYDNFKKEYVSSMIDNAGTGIYHTCGTLDKATMTRTETGTWDDFMTGGKIKVRLVTKIIDANKYILETYDDKAGGGKEVKTGEIVFTRKK